MATTLTPEMQNAQDLLQSLAAQRDDYANKNAQLSAQLMAAWREIGDLKAKLNIEADKPNGHAIEARPT